MGSVLIVTADGFDTSPILRGAWISKNIAGNTLSPPPKNVTAIEPEHGQATTLREQIEQHKENKTCYACHKNIDPYGFALENFDATGQWRTKYRIKKPHKKFFEYANGYKPDLKERLHLFEMIPENAKECRIKDLITKVLLYSLTEEKE